MRRRAFVIGLAVVLLGSLSSSGTASRQSADTGVAATACLRVPAPLVRVLKASLSFSAGGQLFYARAVKGKPANLYFLSAQIRSVQLGAKRPLGTWVVDKLAATATASPLNGAARAYSDLATPDAGAVTVTMRTPGALASQKCVQKLIR